MREIRSWAVNVINRIITLKAVFFSANKINTKFVQSYLNVFSVFFVVFIRGPPFVDFKKLTERRGENGPQSSEKKKR